MGERRIFRANDYLLWLMVDRPTERVEVLRNGRWEPFVLTTEDVLSFTNFKEVGEREAQELDLPD